MQERPAKLNSSFCAQFFRTPAANATSEAARVNFPLPASPASWGEFMNSQDYPKFRQGTIDIILNLCKWIEQAWPDDKDAKLREHLITQAKNFIGHRINQNEGVNSYPLFRDGVPKLAHIVQLIQSNEISLNYRKNVIAALADGLLVCASGSYTNIENALEMLVTDMPGILMGIRRQIAIQTIQGYRPDLDIHTANGAINYHANMLGVHLIEDDRLPVMPADRTEPHNDDRITQVFSAADILREHIEETMTPDAVVEALLARLNLDAIFSDFNNENAFNHLAELERMLLFYGLDHDFSFYKILDQQKLDEDIYQLKSRGEVESYLRYTIANRLAASGYIANNSLTSSGIFKPAVLPEPDHTLQSSSPTPAKK